MSTLLVDGNNLLARSVHAAKGGRTEMAVDGVNTSALLLFVNQLSRFVKIVEPTHMLVCWDAGHTARDEIHPGYKATRTKHVEGTDEEHEAETPWGQTREFLTWSGIAHASLRGWEADDLIALACRQPGPKAILSGDKDLLQLLDAETVQYRPPDGDPWTAEKVRGEMGLEPEQIPLLMALTGDPGDCVPGVRGIGPKKALKALGEVSWDWEALLEALGPEKAEQALLSRRLVDLRHPEFALATSIQQVHRPAIEFKPTAPGSMLWEPLAEFLGRWQMRSVLQRLEDGTLWAKDPAEPTTEGSAEMFAGLDL